MVPPPPSRNLVDQALEWIVFVMDGYRNSIRDEGGLEAFDDFVGITVSNIWDTESGFSKRTTAQGRINFGMRLLNYTLGIMHWVQYERRCYRTVYLTGISDAE